MTQAPSFLRQQLIVTEEQTFRPAIGSRRGEWIAWGCAAAVALLLLVLALLDYPLSGWALFFEVLFLLAGTLISFSNFVERNTEVHLDAAGVRYSSPLRKVALGWGEITKLWSLPFGDAWRVLVIGENRAFNFRTPATLRSGRSASMDIGFPDGERMASMIVGMSGLSLVEPSGEGWISLPN